MRYLVMTDDTDNLTLVFLTEEGYLDTTKPYYDGGEMREKRPMPSIHAIFKESKTDLSIGLITLEDKYVTFMESPDEEIQKMGLSLLLKEKYNVSD